MDTLAGGSSITPASFSVSVNRPPVNNPLSLEGENFGLPNIGVTR